MLQEHGNHDNRKAILGGKAMPGKAANATHICASAQPRGREKTTGGGAGEK